MINKCLVELFLSHCPGFSNFMCIYICNSQWTPGWSYVMISTFLQGLKFRKLRFSVFQDVPLARDIAENSAIL